VNTGEYGDRQVIPLDIPEFKKDLSLARQLKNLLLILEPSVEKISDTYLSAGSDAFLAARKLYSFVKTASDSGAPGTDAIAAELKKRYVRRKSSSQQNTGSQENENQESNA